MYSLDMRRFRAFIWWFCYHKISSTELRSPKNGSDTYFVNRNNILRVRWYVHSILIVLLKWGVQLHSNFMGFFFSQIAPLWNPGNSILWGLNPVLKYPTAAVMSKIRMHKLLDNFTNFLKTVYFYPIKNLKIQDKFCL